MSLILLALGLYVLLRFTLQGLPARSDKPLRRRFLTPLGLVAGFMDATGGGGWGPVGTPAILASGRMEPRKVIGSIDTSEFFVAIAASVGFFVGLSGEGIDVTWVLALLIGGLVAAPIAAWLVRLVPPRVLGSLVGGVIVLTNSRTLLNSDWIAATDGVKIAVYVVVWTAWLSAVVWSFRAYRLDKAVEAAQPQEPEADSVSV
jgi:uncharacterized membrane protein YfcA